MSEVLHVREARDEDVPRLSELEQLKFRDCGIEIYDERFFRCWRTVNPSGLLVSCRADGLVVGYTYQQCVSFDFSEIPRLTTYNDLTDNSYTVRTHKPDGNTIDGMSAVAIAPMAVFQIFKVIEQQMIDEGRKYIISGSRIPGFGSYWRGLQAMEFDLSKIDKVAAAEWYVRQCVLQFGGFLWESFPAAKLALPLPQKPDPVLNKWLKHKGFGAAAVLPQWMLDRKSHDFGVLIVMRNPHVS